MKDKQHILTPAALHRTLPLTSQAMQTVKVARHEAINILHHNDPRLLVILGPCSIHNIQAAIEYAELLKTAIHQFSDSLYFIMRVYFEKPRTTIGWKGLINDPLLDGSSDINLGLMMARKLLLQLAELGVPAATEFLDTFTSHYLVDLISWSAIGARTVESQTHRELASGLPMPVGFKNNTEGNIQAAIDAVSVARHSHRFLSITPEGNVTSLQTSGNAHGHIILRGGNTMQNYAPIYIEEAAKLLQHSQLNPRLVVDCSHGNSMKDHRRQRAVVNSLVNQLKNGSPWISGIMLESNLVGGKQTLNPKKLVHGKSITDACLSWQDTLPLLETLANVVQQRRLY